MTLATELAMRCGEVSTALLELQSEVEKNKSLPSTDRLNDALDPVVKFSDTVEVVLDELGVPRL